MLLNVFNVPTFCGFKKHYSKNPPGPKISILYIIESDLLFIPAKTETTAKSKTTFILITQPLSFSSLTISH